jgi:hypothetical protein
MEVMPTAVESTMEASATTKVKTVGRSGSRGCDRSESDNGKSQFAKHSILRL